MPEQSRQEAAALLLRLFFRLLRGLIRCRRNGRRCSTALAYLAPALPRGNVEVLTDTLVSRILIDGGRAAGVEVLRDTGPESVRAKREVVICAGAYQSPQLLLLSGVGPAHELRSLGIEPSVDLPVGHNLQDHPVVTLVWLAAGESLSAAMTLENTALFEREGTGPLTSSVVSHCPGWTVLLTILFFRSSRLLMAFGVLPVG